MAAIARQPFAPLDGARLLSLASSKNCQNVSSSVGKRKADLLEKSDWENVTPVVFVKRAKGASSSGSIAKPSGFAFDAHFSSAALPDVLSTSRPAKVSNPRQTLQPKSQLARLRGSTAAPKPALVANPPAGRSPAGKRGGLLSSSRRQHPAASGPLAARLDRLVNSAAGSAKSAKPWTVDGALKSTIKPAPRHGKNKSRLSRGSNNIGSKAASWFFEIHEDSPEQEMTNLLQHSTCVLDISSDEETGAKAERDREAGCDKENVAPAGHIAAQAPPSSPPSATGLEERSPLGELNPRDFYAEGCDEISVFLIDEDEETEVEDNDSALAGFQFAPKLGETALETVFESLDELVEKPAEGTTKKAAAVLAPIEGAEESFELWESGSAKDEA
ncbi:hypothetical protein ISF_07091 [Cordyceps fumosorosea ARSEF 2679]|uniref:Thymidylate kinase n=1 Tax=Cordyceps fumosorosea (strain ARSEF 2679) TaxID=1081104 RepID=A0A167PZX4_CORFA|nr:hypothetical protein ISF_07091 [Cordyceps fumosorosea ARSEF 2679]OAA57170.1 hypothetical protein ISF_07091 [Cordyceps fumosorosea ARSEF 2679]